MAIKVLNVEWQTLLISWIGHCVDQILRNRYQDWDQAVWIPQIMSFFKSFEEVVAEFCFRGSEFESNFWSLLCLWFKTPSGQILTKSLEKKYNLGYSDCLISVPVLISHYLVYIVPFSWNKQNRSFDILSFYGYILAGILAQNGS
jgi:hypothetical protein